MLQDTCKMAQDGSKMASDGRKLPYIGALIAPYGLFFSEDGYVFRLRQPMMAAMSPYEGFKLAHFWLFEWISV